MKHLTFLLFVCLFIFSACTPADQQIDASSSQPSHLPATASASPIPADPTITPRPTKTITPNPTQPPEGIFAIKIYPLLVLDYDPLLWDDLSEYSNTEWMINFLQHRELDTCRIGPMGPSGFWPEDMAEKKLGNIDYQVKYDQVDSTGGRASFYFAMDAIGGRIENEFGIPHFAVMYDPSQAEGCKAAAEDVLATLRYGGRMD